MLVEFAVEYNPMDELVGNPMEGEEQEEVAANALSKGQSVVVDGLVTAAAMQHNGKTATVLHFSASKGRFAVRMADSGKILLIKPANLTPKLTQDYDTDVIVCESEARKKVVLAVANKLGMFVHAYCQS